MKAPLIAGQTKAQQAVAVAQQQIGKPYVWADEGPNGFDCSGLIAYCYGQVGIHLPHYAPGQLAACVRVTSPAPGDLWFGEPGGNTAGPGAPGHVEMYIGGGQLIGADSPATGVAQRSVASQNTIGFIAYGKLPGSGSASSGVVPGATAVSGCLMTCLYLLTFLVTMGLIR